MRDLWQSRFGLRTLFKEYLAMLRLASNLLCDPGLKTEVGLSGKPLLQPQQGGASKEPELGQAFGRLLAMRGG